MDTRGVKSGQGVCIIEKETIGGRAASKKYIRAFWERVR